MLKKYSSKSCISVSVKLSTGSSIHLSFPPRTGGGSVFYTDNEKLQEGLEKHPKYGKLFKLTEVIEDKKPKKPAPPAANPQGTVTPATDAPGTVVDEGDSVETPTDTAPAPVPNAPGMVDDEGDIEPDATLKEVEVTCNDDAKDYLAEHFGVSRTTLRNRATIDSVAEANGVKFVWK